MLQSRNHRHFEIRAKYVIVRARPVGAIDMGWLIGGIVVYFLGSGLKHMLHERRIRRTLEPGAGLSRLR